jgi:hypothetical protein
MAIEQTDGFLFRPQFFAQVAELLRASGLKCYRETIDARWSALYLPSGPHGPLAVPANLDVARTLSRQVPLLSFHYSQDFHWRYAVFEGGAEVAGIAENFALGLPFAEPLAQARGMRCGDFYYEHGDEVRALPAYRAAFRAQFALRNVAVFAAAFGLRPFRCGALERLLADGDPQDGWWRVEVFRWILELEYLKWKSYRADEDEERQPERARDPSNFFWAGVTTGWLLRLPEPTTSEARALMSTVLETAAACSATSHCVQRRRSILPS